VVIVECDSAHKDGVEFLSFLKEAHPSVRRVALTNTWEYTPLHLAFATGALEAVLERPWDSETLALAVVPARS
jgi:response regulator RpfG family c-di-GMP phosphodiesterase